MITFGELTGMKIRYVLEKNLTNRRPWRKPRKKWIDRLVKDAREMDNKNYSFRCHNSIERPTVFHCRIKLKQKMFFGSSYDIVLITIFTVEALNYLIFDLT